MIHSNLHSRVDNNNIIHYQTHLMTFQCLETTQPALPRALHFLAPLPPFLRVARHILRLILISVHMNTDIFIIVVVQGY